MHWRAAQRTTTRTRRCRYCPGGRTMVPSTSASSAIVPCPRVIRWRPAWRWMSTVSIKRESIGEAWQGVTEVWVSGVWGQTALKSRKWNGAKNCKRPYQKKKIKKSRKHLPQNLWLDRRFNSFGFSAFTVASSTFCIGLAKITIYLGWKYTLFSKHLSIKYTTAEEVVSNLLLSLMNKKKNII